MTKAVTKLKADMEERIRALELKDIHVILVKDPYVVARLQNLNIETKHPIQIVQVDEWSDLKTLDDKQLDAMGLVRKAKSKIQLLT